MNTIIIKNSKDEKIIFKGQYYTALQKLFKGFEINMYDFNNGSWNATKQISHFIGLLKISDLWDDFSIRKDLNSKSLRTTTLKICDGKQYLIDNINTLDYRCTTETIVKYCFSKENFYVFEFDENINIYDSIQITIDYKNNQYSIYGIKGTSAELLDNNYLNYFDLSILYCAEKN